MRLSLEQTYSKLVSVVGNANSVIDLLGEVRNQTVTAPLREETERDDDNESVTVALGAEEVEVTATFLVLELNAEGLLDLTVFKLYGCIILIAVGVVVGEDIEGLLVTVPGNEPTGGFRAPEDQSKLNNGGRALKSGWDSP